MIPISQVRNVQCRDSKAGQGPHTESLMEQAGPSSAAFSGTAVTRVVNCYSAKTCYQPGRPSLLQRLRNLERKSHTATYSRGFTLRRHSTSTVRVNTWQKELWDGAVWLQRHPTTRIKCEFKKPSYPTRTQMPAHVAMAPARQQRHIGTTIICPFTNMLPEKHPYAFF